MLVAVFGRIVDKVTPIERKQKILMEDVRPPVKFVEIKPPQPREVDDDWFVLLDVAAKEPGILTISFFFFVAVTVKWNETIKLCQEWLSLS